MKLRTVTLHDSGNGTGLEWIFKGSIREAEKDLRSLVQKMGITHWFGTISAMQGRLVIRP